MTTTEESSHHTVILNLSPKIGKNPINMDHPDKVSNGVAENGNVAKNEIAEKEKILEPFTYVLSMKGKNFRRQLGIAFNHWFGVESQDLERILEIVDKLHNASLVIDDIEDHSELRRGHSAAHLVYGVPLAINAANYVYFDVLKSILEFGSFQAVKIFTEQMLSLHHGQGMELYWRDCHQFDKSINIFNGEEKDDENENIRNKDVLLNNKRCRLISGLSSLPTEKEYQEVIVKKTSGLFLLLVELLRERSVKSDVSSLDPTRLTQLCGLCFQVRDDLMNLISSEYKETKGYCEDISEGKLSFPAVHCLNKRTYSLEKRARLVAILQMKTTCNVLKEEAFQILKESGTITYTKERLSQLKGEIGREIETLGGNPMLAKMLAKFWG